MQTFNRKLISDVEFWLKVKYFKEYLFALQFSQIYIKNIQIKFKTESDAKETSIFSAALLVLEVVVVAAGAAVVVVLVFDPEPLPDPEPEPEPEPVA